MNLLSRSLARHSGRLAIAVFALQIFLAASANADYVATLSSRLSPDPEGIADALDGYQLGDRISFIAETTPAFTGIVSIAAWTTLYVPAGAEVVGAELVRADGDGSYSGVPAKDVAAAHDDCGNRGCAFATTGPYQNGRINEVQQDVGVFYSTDLQTALLGTPLAANPTGVAVQSLYNQWDFNQIKAFGEGGAFSGNGGQGNTPILQIGSTWFGTGSPVAGTGAYYRNDYDPSCDPSTGTAGAAFQADLTCTGPWQRVRHDNGRIGGSGAIVPATTGAAAALVNTAVGTSAGHDFEIDGALSASTNALRVVHGRRQIGNHELARITFEVTDATAFLASFSDDTLCLSSTGGDFDKGDPNDPGRRGTQDNPWRYYEGNLHQCFVGSANGALIVQPEFVNGVASSGASLSLNDVVGYAITLVNTSGVTLYDVDFSDSALSNLELVAAATAGCPYPDYAGNQSGLPTLDTLNATTAFWNRLDILPVGESVTLHLCGRVTSGAQGAVVESRSNVLFDINDGGEQEPLSANVVGTVLSRIAGRAFEDADADEAFSAGDLPTDNVPVHLHLNDGGSPGLLLASTTSNTLGVYEFNGFSAGDYFVVSGDLPGYTSLRDADTAPPCTGNACNEIAVSLPSGGTSTGNDFLDQAPLPPAVPALPGWGAGVLVALVMMTASRRLRAPQVYLG